MTVESNCAIAIAIFSDWLKNLAPLFQPTKKESQNQVYLVRAICSLALSKLLLNARNSDWFIALFAPVVIVRSNYFGISFSTIIWKPL